MSCPACSAELPDGAAFCPACGARQAPAACASCGSELLAGAAFCFRCGTPVGTPGPPTAAAPDASRSERRLTSVLFADLVSYTTLSEARDSEEVRALLSEYFEVCSTVVSRYGGVVEKFIGDAVMAVWGVPTAHEDDAERAVRAGMDLVSAVHDLGDRLAIPELALRAGVVTGEVAASLGASNQGMVAGDAVNTAARVQAAAGPGEVWVDDTTRGLTSAAVTYVDVGEHLLKGKSQPVRLHRAGTVIAAVGGSQRVDGLEAPLAGRERELRMIKELFHATAESGRPRMVVLDGDAGIGKTRLAWEFEKYVSGIELTTVWHRGRCLSYGEGVAYWALAEAVRTRLDLVEDGRPADVPTRVEQGLAGLVADSAEREWMSARLTALLGGEHGEFAREDLFAAWTRFFERVAEDGEVVTFVVDDAQYADEAFVEYLDYFVAHARTPVFLLVLARAELLETHPQLGGRRLARVPLEPLPEAAMDRLVDGLVDGLPDAARAALVERAEGIPLYAVETVRALIDRDVVRPQDGRYVVAPDASVDLTSVAAPPSLHALVAARLDALEPDERRVLSDASVLGASFTRDGIEALSGHVPDLDGVLARLQRKELIGTENDRFSAERGQFRFEQAVVRQVAYATLSRRTRVQQHLAAADHLEHQESANPDLVGLAAQHLVEAIEATAPEAPSLVELNARAMGLLMRSGDRSAKLGAHEAALSAYLRVVERSQDPLEGARGQAAAARSAAAIGRLGDAAQWGTQARETFMAHGALEEATWAAVTACLAHFNFAEVGPGLSLGREAYAAVSEVDGLAAARGHLAAVLALGLNRSGGESREVLGFVGEALRLAQESGDTFTLSRAMLVLATHQSSRGSSRVARAVYRELLQVAREGGHWVAAMGGSVNLSLHERLHDLPRAVELLTQGAQDAHDHGLVPVTLETNLVVSLWHCGRWERVAELLLGFSEGWADLSIGDQVILKVVDLWRADAGLGELAGETSGDSDDRNWQSWDAMRRATLTEDPLEASRCHLEALARSLEDAGMSDDYPMQVGRAIQHAVRHDLTEILSELSDQLGRAPLGLASELLAAFGQWAAAARDARSSADATTVERDLRRAVELLTACGASVDATIAREDLARWLVRQDRSTEASLQLEGVRAAYAELGASAWLARLDDLSHAWSQRRVTT